MWLSLVRCCAFCSPELAEFLIDFFPQQYSPWCLVLFRDFSAYCGTFDTYRRLYWLLMIGDVGNCILSIACYTDNKTTCSIPRKAISNLFAN